MEAFGYANATTLSGVKAVNLPVPRQSLEGVNAPIQNTMPPGVSEWGLTVISSVGMQGGEVAEDPTMQKKTGEGNT